MKRWRSRSSFQRVDDSAAHEPEIAGIARHRQVAHLFHHAIERRRREFLDRRLAGTIRTRAVDHVEAFAPARDEFGYQFGLVLQVRIDDNDGIGIDMIDARRQRELLAEIAAQLQRRDARIGQAQRLHDVPGIVAASVVDVENAAIKIERIENEPETALEFAQAIAFVVGGDDDGERLHGRGLARKQTRGCYWRTVTVARKEWRGVRKESVVPALLFSLLATRFSSFPAQIRRSAELLRLSLDPGDTTLHIGTRLVDAKTPRVRQYGGQTRGLVRGQRAGRLAEIHLARGRRAVDAVAELGHVQIDLENALLRPAQFDQHGEVRLEPFAHEAAPVPEKQIFRGLLADRTRTTQTLAVFGVLDRIADRFDVETVVVRKFLVFRGHQRDRQRRRPAASAPSWRSWKSRSPAIQADACRCSMKPE